MIWQGSYDVIVVGAGAAGLSAALMLGRSKRTVLVIGSRTRRNSAVDAVHNIPFAEGTAPGALYSKMEQDAVGYGVDLLWDEATSAKATDGQVVVRTANGTYQAATLLLATGVADELPAWLPQEAWGRLAFDCPYCHTRELEGAPFVCVGEGVVTLEHALLAVQYTKDMTAVIADQAAADSDRAQRLRAAGGKVVVDTVVHAAELPSQELALHTSGGTELTAGIVLLSGTKRPRTGLARQLGLALDADGAPVTSPFGRTSHPRVWNAGNVSDQYFMWTGAASSGINAARSISEELAYGAGRQ
ncbi:NAD(P)/FAD-dependent oxidoreductase [Streptomyces sp. NPDC002677]|uniref:NAD(P)/FAD-dependent oxidoreductase n=1 Tax=Streptomyces sp. NPDC002677 TaxID=3154774 RepID=UPI003323C7B7